MHLKNIYIIVFFLFSLSCSDERGWSNEGVGETFSIKRQKSYNYSEMLSGDLDSTDKRPAKTLEEFLHNNNLYFGMKSIQ